MRATQRSLQKLKIFHRLPWILALLILGVPLLSLSQAAPPAEKSFQDPAVWKPPIEDGLHDPEGPAINELQHPGEALQYLPPDVVGNMVRWVQALREGYIQPRTNIIPETKIQVLDLDIIYPKTGDNWFVRFPHRQHTEWLDCVNCHDTIFKTEYRATPMSMAAILDGEYCGRCHGAVAFPLTECNRCHSVDPGTFNGKYGPQY